MHTMRRLWRLFVAAHIATGVRANLFTDLLAKPGRQTISGVGAIADQYNRLADYTRGRIEDERRRLGASTEAVGGAEAAQHSP